MPKITALGSSLVVLINKVEVTWPANTYIKVMMNNAKFYALLRDYGQYQMFFTIPKHIVIKYNFKVGDGVGLKLDRVRI